jgi:hypothetical protein
VKLSRTPALSAIVLSVILLVIALAALVISILPYEPIADLADTLSEGRADFFTEEFFASIQRLTLLAFMGLLFLGGIVIIFRRKVSDLIRTTGNLTGSEIQAGIDSLKTHWREANSLERWTLGILTLAAFGLRAAFMNQPMRYDEAVSWVVFSSKPFFITISYYPFPNNHIVHNLLVTLVTSIFGSSLWSIRLVDFVHGVLLVPLTWAVIRPWRGKAAALIASAWLAGTSMFVLHSTNARGYGILVMSFLLMIPAARRLMNRGGYGPALILVILGGLAFWNIPLAILPFGAILTWVAMNWILDSNTAARGEVFRGILVSGLGAGLLSLLLYMPVFIVSGPSALFGNEYVAAKDFAYLASNLGDGLAYMLETWVRDMPLLLLVLAALGLAAALLSSFVRRRRGVGLLPAALVWSVFVTLLFREVTPPRGWMFLHWTIIASSALGLGWLASHMKENRQRIRESITLALVAVFLIGQGWPMLRDRTPETVSDTGVFPDAEPVAEYLLDRLEQGDVILSGGRTSFPLVYYMQEKSGSSSAVQTNARWGKTTYVIADTLYHPLEFVLDDVGVRVLPDSSLDLLETIGSTKIYRIPEDAAELDVRDYSVQGRKGQVKT